MPLTDEIAKRSAVVVVRAKAMKPASRRASWIKTSVSVPEAPEPTTTAAMALRVTAVRVRVALPCSRARTANADISVPAWRVSSTRVSTSVTVEPALPTSTASPAARSIVHASQVIALPATEEMASPRPSGAGTRESLIRASRISRTPPALAPAEKVALRAREMRSAVIRPLP